MQVYRRNRLVRTARYALIENVNDGSFLKREWARQHPGGEYDDGGYMLFEADNRGLEFKKGKKNFDTDEMAEIGLFETVINREAALAGYMDEDDILRFTQASCSPKTGTALACATCQIIIIYLYQERNRKSPKCASFQKGWTEFLEAARTKWASPRGSVCRSALRTADQFKKF